MTSIPLEAKLEELPSFTPSANASSSFLQTASESSPFSQLTPMCATSKPKRGRSCLLAKLRDLLKITGCNVRLRANPAAADRVNERRGDKLADVLRVDAAGRNGRSRRRDPRAPSWQKVRHTRLLGRTLQRSVPASYHDDFRRRHAAGRHGNAVFHQRTTSSSKPGATMNFRRTRRLFTLFKRNDRARTDEAYRAAFRDCLDRIRRSSRAERDFHHVHAAGQQKPSPSRPHLLRRQYDNRHNSRHFKSFRHFYICSCNSIYQNLQSRITLVERPPIIILFENMSQNPDVVHEFLHIILAARAKNVNNATIFFNKRAMRNVGWKIKHIPALTE